MGDTKKGMPLGFKQIEEDRHYWRRGRRLGYFDDFKLPKWMKENAM